MADVEDAGRTLPDGELMVRGPIVMPGYFRNERATRETIEPDGWLHTGDIERRDSDGFYFIVDRKKDMILTAEFNVYPAEVERVVAAYPAVALVAVGSLPDALKSEAVKAYIVLKNGVQANEAGTIAYCRQHLAAYKVPSAVQFVDDLPKTSDGEDYAAGVAEVGWLGVWGCLMGHAVRGTVPAGLMGTTPWILYVIHHS